MNAVLPFIVSGIAAGAIYGMAASGLVLTYKTSGIFNFAHGAVAAAAAYLFYFLTHELQLPWLAAFVISVLILGPALGLLFEVLARFLAPQSVAMKVVGTIGVILIVQGLARVLFGPDPLRIPQFLPNGSHTFRMFGVVVTVGQLTVTAVAVAASALLYALFRFTRMGVAMRAVVDDSDLVGLHGVNARGVRRFAWVIGVTFAALSGVLLAPLVGIDAVVLTYLAVQAFGAAAVGAFSSIPITFVAGIGLGIIADVSKTYVLQVPWLSGLPASLPFIVLFIVLLVTPKRKLAMPTAASRRPPLQWRGPWRLKLLSGVIVVGALVLLPIFDSLRISFFTVGLAQGIMLLSLGLLVRTSGQISLASGAFAGIGAVVFSQLMTDFGLPWLVAVVLSGIIVMPVGALIALPAIRLSTLFLALATFGFGLLVEQLFYPTEIGFTTLAQGRIMPRPPGFESDLNFYYVALAFLVVSALVMLLIHSTRLGRVLQAMSDSPTAVSVMGLNTYMTRVIVFCISAFFAAIAGIVYGVSVNFAVSGDSFFSSFNSLVFLAILAIAPFASPWYALFGVIPLIVQAYAQNVYTTYWLNVVFGVFAVLTAAVGGTPTMPEAARRWFERVFGGRATAPPQAGPSFTPAKLAGQVSVGDGSGLRVAGLRVRFGGMLAVDDVAFEAPRGRITGLIGPNGAGKTTTFNAVSGLNRNISGQISLHGVDASRYGPAARGRLGLGRTFQIPQLCETLSVATNVALGREAGQAGSNPFSQIVATRAERATTRQAAFESMELCGITDLADLQAGSLSTGQRRLVELARALSGPFDILLLDEPSSGLDHEETAEFGRILQRVVQERGCGIVLVEHDMSLVMGICDHIYVLDFGRLLEDGKPVEIAASPKVRAAYLGSEELEPEMKIGGAVS
ncbi:branched-chain amino acid ABC transporter permease/ATP-binding protein [Rhodococcus sp. SC4]|uniref:branched-chain amino acid ABC transporter permease/ATP-binding protein n=1 Tax=unclassified Rhodococcus (in: high G+C Gram-positive bacteria) TaxID=192944 RepID=UPI00076A328A|nr:MULTISPECIES: branched-chain amino acid ABC transporter permease/ATP-binding protein [unclassified Rhodococcus (in: high G+C Gram-positive bacteria)]KXF53864.1 branched-chain amino acid ABC transporter permease/ATP-binding protein [Rhodococcus sp. SC4]KXX57407.1 branched-chain amino acid ABC transporter permease/ATP-binding protein [Rhodococcus sp. LB1]PBC57957.1 branched-chain amino acid ABC transporter permease/ATP-binding protein [Rhodococcus sp. ACPA1]